MLWALLSGIGACTNAAYFIVNKKFLETIDPNFLAASEFLCASFFLMGISWIHGIPVIGPWFLGAILVSTLLNILATILTFRALASSDISLAVPMLSFTPLFLVGTAAIFLGEIPSAIGIAGIITIVAGSYILNMAQGHTRITDPFRNMFTHPGVMAMLTVAFLYAVSINFDKLVVQNSDAIFGSGFEFLLLGSSFGVLAVLGYYMRHPGFLHPGNVTGTSGKPTPPSALHPPWKYLAVAGIFTGVLITIEAFTINTAYLIQIVPYVIALKRMSIILIVLYGTLIFREKEIVRRLAGAGLMVLGALLILVFP
jgi:drug/metabolite transporter (DMT)-like permease